MRGRLVLLNSFLMGHIRTHFSYLARQFPGAVIRETPELLVVDSGLDNDTFNAVVEAQLATGNVAELARQAVASFDGRAFSWWLGPEDSPSELPEILGGLGLVRAEEELGMELSFSDESTRPDADEPVETPLRILRATNEKSTLDYSFVVAANWTPPDADVLTFYCETWRAAVAPMSPVRLYVGYLGDKPVSAAELTVAPDGTAGVYGVATVEWARRRGFGTAMLQHVIEEARVAGAKRVELQAAAAATSIYRRLGFVQCGVWAEYKPAGPGNP